MLCDWWLTIAQEKERTMHYSEHYQSYPVNTIEGNPAMQGAVRKQKLLDPRHFIIAVVCGAAVGLFIPLLYEELKYPLLGYIWGVLLIVNTQHLSNLLGYRACRRGLHGKLYLHQRTGLMTQSGRYLAMALLLSIIFVLSGSTFILGIAIAGFFSAARQLLWYRKVPKIPEEDIPPVID
jgi:hypothetical protein